MEDWSRERCRGWQALTYRKFELDRVCLRTSSRLDCVYPPTDLCSLMVNICSCELFSRRCKKSPSHFRFGRLSGSSYKPQKPRCSYGQVKDERNIVIEYVQVRKSSRVGKLRLSNMHIPICLLLTGRSLARTLLCAANMPPRGLSNKVSDECICSPLWKFMRAFVVRYVNFTEHSYFCNFHAYYIRNWDIGFSIGHSRNCSNTVRFMLVCFMYICLFASPFPCSARILLSKNLKHKGSPPTFALMAP